MTPITQRTLRTARNFAEATHDNIVAALTDLVLLTDTPEIDQVLRATVLTSVSANLKTAIATAQEALGMLGGAL